MPDYPSSIVGPDLVAGPSDFRCPDWPDCLLGTAAEGEAFERAVGEAFHYDPSEWPVVLCVEESDDLIQRAHDSARARWDAMVAE